MAGFRLTVWWVYLLVGCCSSRHWTARASLIQWNCNPNSFVEVQLFQASLVSRCLAWRRTKCHSGMGEHFLFIIKLWIVFFALESVRKSIILEYRFYSNIDNIWTYLVSNNLLVQILICFHPCYLLYYQNCLYHIISEPTVA